MIWNYALMVILAVIIRKSDKESNSIGCKFRVTGDLKSITLNEEDFATVLRCVPLKQTSSDKVLKPSCLEIQISTFQQLWIGRS